MGSPPLFCIFFSLMKVNMTLRQIFTGTPSPSEPEEPIKTPELVRGQIYFLGKGFGFCESDAVPYKRIFFHWQNLEHNTLDFEQLERGMTLEFRPVSIKNETTGKIEWRAQKVRVVK
jgi:cold shock CspA family protein